MFKIWLQNYQTFMTKTRHVSQFIAFMVFIQSLIELIGVPIAVSYAENVKYSVVWNAAVEPGLFLVGFGVRFFYLIFAKSLEPIWLASTWTVAALAVVSTLYFNNFRYDHFYLELPFLFPLTTAGLFFLLFSAVRFSITASVAALSRNELDSNS